MKIPFNKEWFLVEREDYANYLFVTHIWQDYTVLAKKWGFVPSRYLSAEYIKSACNLFLLKDDYDRANRMHFQMLFSQPEVWDKLHLITKRNSNHLFHLGRRIKRLVPSRLSNRELLRWVNIFQKVQSDVHGPRGPMWFLETPNNLVSGYLQAYLAEKQSAAETKIKTLEAYQCLIAPLEKSIWTQEIEELARIALIKDKSKRNRSLQVHAKKYEWLEYGLQGKILDSVYFQNEMGKIRKQGSVQFLKRLQQETKDIIKKQKQVIKVYNIGKQHLRIFKIVQDSLFSRLYSKDSQFFSYYCIEGILKEIGKRCHLTLEQIRFLAPEDYKEILIYGKDFSAITTTRQKHSVHISDRGETVFYLGKTADAVMKKIKFYKSEIVKEELAEIKGQPAYNGKVRGRAKIVNVISEMVKVHAGNILVSHMTNPSIVPAMKMAAAIVTDLGGITCHAAIVARELKKPCVIGTKIATEVLKDGDLVEVDANEGIVKRL